MIPVRAKVILVCTLLSPNVCRALRSSPRASLLKDGSDVTNLLQNVHSASTADAFFLLCCALGQPNVAMAWHTIRVKRAERALARAMKDTRPKSQLSHGSSSTPIVSVQSRKHKQHSEVCAT